MLSWKVVSSDPVLLKDFFKEYRRVIGKGGCDTPRCAGKWEGMYNELVKAKNQGMAERQYRMIKGKLFNLPGSSTHYSDANMTDEIAVVILQNNPAYAKYFINPPMPPAMPPGRQAEFKENVGKEAPAPQKSPGANSTMPAPEPEPPGEQLESEDTPSTPLVKPIKKQPGRPGKKGK